LPSVPFFIDLHKRAKRQRPGRDAETEKAIEMSMLHPSASIPSRIWQSQGKKSDAFDLLSGIYGWFNEGLDTPDLIDAKVLLEELS
jgi:hypothetical protein